MAEGVHYNDQSILFILWVGNNTMFDNQKTDTINMISSRELCIFLVKDSSITDN